MKAQPIHMVTRLGTAGVTDQKYYCSTSSYTVSPQCSHTVQFHMQEVSSAVHEYKNSATQVFFLL